MVDILTGPVTVYNHWMAFACVRGSGDTRTYNIGTTLPVWRRDKQTTMCCVACGPYALRRSDTISSVDTAEIDSSSLEPNTALMPSLPEGIR